MGQKSLQKQSRAMPFLNFRLFSARTSVLGRKSAFGTFNLDFQSASCLQVIIRRCAKVSTGNSFFQVSENHRFLAYSAASAMFIDEI